jgi:hypothetical protein
MSGTLGLPRRALLDLTNIVAVPVEADGCARGDGLSWTRGSRAEVMHAHCGVWLAVAVGGGGGDADVEMPTLVGRVGGSEMPEGKGGSLGDGGCQSRRVAATGALLLAQR